MTWVSRGWVFRNDYVTEMWCISEERGDDDDYKGYHLFTESQLMCQAQHQALSIHHHTKFPDSFKLFDYLSI